MDRDLTKLSKIRIENIKQYLDILSSGINKPLKECDVLDVGCSVGTFSFALSPHMKQISGIDINNNDISKANEKIEKTGIKNVKFKAGSIFDIDRNHKYDIIIASDVIEHLSQQKKLIKICLDLLKKKGVLFINTPNKWFPIEAHKKLPFLSYLPKKWANKYSKLFGRGEYLEYYLLSYSDFIGLLNAFPTQYEFKSITIKLIHRIGKKMVGISPMFWRLSPAFQVIVKKQKGGK